VRVWINEAIRAESTPSFGDPSIEVKEKRGLVERREGQVKQSMWSRSREQGGVRELAIRITRAEIVSQHDMASLHFPGSLRFVLEASSLPALQ
jgi:hypothetical protein